MRLSAVAVRGVFACHRPRGGAAAHSRSRSPPVRRRGAYAPFGACCVLRSRDKYTSIAFAETLVLEGIAASIGSIGDAYDNALAETTIGMFKTEAIGRGSPFHTGPLRTIDDVEYVTLEWVDWYNNR
jgi:transposase InsO family protein